MTAAVRMHDRGPLHLAEWFGPMKWRGICPHLGDGVISAAGTEGDDLMLHLRDGGDVTVVRLWLYAEDVPELGRFCTRCVERLRTLLNDRILLLNALDQMADSGRTGD